VNVMEYGAMNTDQVYNVYGYVSSAKDPIAIGSGNANSLASTHSPFYSGMSTNVHTINLSNDVMKIISPVIGAPLQGGAKKPKQKQLGGFFQSFFSEAPAVFTSGSMDMSKIRNTGSLINDQKDPLKIGTGDVAELTRSPGAFSSGSDTDMMLRAMGDQTNTSPVLGTSIQRGGSRAHTKKVYKDTRAKVNKH
jgi:hypothetical protein